MQTISDEQLVEQFRAGDENAFRKLVKRYEKDIYRYLVRFLGNPAWAEDVFQDTFLQVHLSAGTFDISRSFRPWLYTIASNKARDFMRSQARRPTVNVSAIESDDDDQIDLWSILLQDNETPSTLFDRNQEIEIVREVVAQMPENLREILMLAYFKQLPYKEIAEVLDVPLGTVKSRLHAAVAAFARLYQKANK